MRHTPHDQQQPQPPQPQPPQPPQPAQPLHPLHPLPHPRQPPQRQARSYCSPNRGVPAFSLSKTKNVPKLTSEISSSLSVMRGPGAMSFEGVSATVPAVPAEAPLASDKET